jgi:GDP-L-fucose synthase
VGRDSYDLRERVEVDSMLGANAPDAIVHLSAVVGGIGANSVAPGRFFYENARMGIELLDAARVAKIDKVVIAGTVCSYPKHCPVPFSEDDLWRGYPEETNAPYGLAKKMLIVQAQAYRQEYGCNFVTLLPTNLYGPGDNFDPATSHVVPALLRRFVDAAEHGADSVVVWGDGSATREFLYVTDCAEAFVQALERYDSPEPLNVGSGIETSVKELVERIRDLTGYGGHVEWDTTRPNGQPRRCLSTDRAEHALGWRASTSLPEGLAATHEWWMTHRS